MTEYSSNPLTYLPPTARKPVYFVYALAGLVLGCLQLAIDVDWTATALAIYGLVGTGIGATAGANTPRAGVGRRRAAPPPE